jgi:hypothetical protein
MPACLSCFHFRTSYHYHFENFTYAWSEQGRSRDRVVPQTRSSTFSSSKARPHKRHSFSASLILKRSYHISIDSFHSAMGDERHKKRSGYRSFWRPRLDTQPEQSQGSLSENSRMPENSPGPSNPAPKRVEIPPEAAMKGSVDAGNCPPAPISRQSGAPPEAAHTLDGPSDEPPPYHDWTIIPDTALLPPPPTLFNTTSPTTNATLAEADRAHEWCELNPLLPPISLKDATHAHIR